MDDDRRRHIWDLLSEALAMADEERRAHLERIGRTDPEARREVEALLAYEDDGRDPLASERIDAAVENRRVGNYRLIRELGRGGQAVVYLAVDERVGREVALKVVHGFTAPDRVLKRFRREAEITSRLELPGICPVYEVGLDDVPFIAMRRLEGCSLTDEKFSRGEVLALVERVARTLHAAHLAGVVHRDIKPGNVIVTAEGEPVVLDFGLARRNDAEGATLTVTNDVLGTPAYMSPEQVRGMPLDARTDVYSLGVVLFECLTGRRPFERASVQETYLAILNDAPPDPRAHSTDVSTDLKVVVETALEKSRDRRYATARELADDLRRVLERRPIHARPASTLTKVMRWSRRNPAVVATLGVVLAALVVVFAANRRLMSSLEDRDAALTAKQAALEDYDRLGDLSRLTEARRRADELWPASPARIDELAAWISEYEPLVERLDVHRRTLAALREEAAPYTEADRERDHRDVLHRLEQRRIERAFHVEGLEQAITEQVIASIEDQIDRLDDRIDELQEELKERKSWSFGADYEKVFKQNTLAELVRELTAFADPRTGTLASVRERLRRARIIEDRTVTRHRAAWSECIEAVAGSPRYGGLRLEPTVGLVPLGEDPVSGLFEFLHWDSHDESSPLPRRGPDGRFEIGPETGMILVLVPAGTFWKGSQSDDEGGRNYDPHAGRSEGPPELYEIMEAFLLSKFEMTQGQWARCPVEDAGPSHYAAGFTHSALPAPVDLRHPVEQVSWEECMAALRRVGLVLPSGLAWEYAARADTSDVWPGTSDFASIPDFGNIAGVELLGVNRGAETEIADAYQIHAPVGSFRPNAFGFHDMFGNVLEWTIDGRNSNLKGARGGSYDDRAQEARMTSVQHVPRGVRSLNLGCRPAWTLRR